MTVDLKIKVLSVPGEPPVLLLHLPQCKTTRAQPFLVCLILCRAAMQGGVGDQAGLIQNADNIRWTNTQSLPSRGLQSGIAKSEYYRADALMAVCVLCASESTKK